MNYRIPNIFLLLIVMITLFAIPLSVNAQETQNIRTKISKLDSLQNIQVELQNGDIFTGKYISHDLMTITIQNSSGTFNLNIDRIKTLANYESNGLPEDWFKNPNTSRLFFSPTGRMLPKGSGYYQNIYVFFSNVAYSVSDYLTLSAGASMIPGIGLSNQLFFVSAKTGYSFSDRHHLAGGISMPLHKSINTAAGVAYGVYTYGTNRYNITGGTGLFFAEGSSSAAFMIGGEVRISKRFSMVTENFYSPEGSQGIISYGLRFMGEQMSVDLAFIRPGIEEADINIGVPYLDFVFNF